MCSLADSKWKRWWQTIPQYFPIHLPFLFECNWIFQMKLCYLTALVFIEQEWVLWNNNAYFWVMKKLAHFIVPWTMCLIYVFYSISIYNPYSNPYICPETVWSTVYTLTNLIYKISHFTGKTLSQSHSHTNLDAYLDITFSRPQVNNFR